MLNNYINLRWITPNSAQITSTVQTPHQGSRTLTHVAGPRNSVSFPEKRCPKGVVQLYCFYIYIYIFIQVSSWSAWGSCSAPPGRCSTNSGTRTRTRRVTLSPSCGGSSCPTLSDTSRCTPVPIPCKVILVIFFPVFSNLLLVCQVFFAHLSFFKMDCHLQNHP